MVSSLQKLQIKNLNVGIKIKKNKRKRKKKKLGNIIK